MKIKINGKEYELRFGIKFNRELDEVYTQSVDGFEFGVGVEKATSYLAMKNNVALFEVIKAGTSHLRQRPTDEEIEQAIEEYGNDGKLSDLYDDILKAMGNSPFLTDKMSFFKEQAKVNPKERQA